MSVSMMNKGAVRRGVKLMALAFFVACVSGLLAGILNLDENMLYAVMGGEIALLIAFGLPYVLTDDRLWERVER